ncbi:multiple organellar RNA editing factor [Trifolium repens]|nr:multiple organellar RNA editing factor [Trifolium repens]
MASSLILFRRCLRPLSGLHHSLSATLTSLSVPIISSSSSSSISSSPNVGVQFRSFRSTSISLLSSRYEDKNNIDSIGPDTILFEGCDYNHWLFVMDFPKDNKPPPEEMIRVYEETCAKGLNISVEEAKKKIYACSTTTYTGFQAVVTEEESKKFEGLPGVIFVLPDSYIDPVNKQYGGDQYIDGKIIPRPPPVQFGRNQGGRRDFNRQNNSMPNNQGSPSYNNRGPVPRDGRNYGPPQNYQPQHNYGPPPQIPPQQNIGQQPSNMRFGSALPHYPPPPQQSHDQASQGYPPKPNYGQVSQNYSPPQNINQAPHNYPQQQTGPASPQYPPQQSFGPPGQGERRNYVPQQNFGPPGQGERRNYAPQQNFGPPGQGERNYVPQQNFGPPGQGERNFVPQQNFGPPQQNFGPPRQGERRDPVSSGGEWDFKPSYMEEFEQAEKEKSTGEGRY